MKTHKVYNLVLVDDHVLLRDALAKLINTFEEFAVTAVAGNGEELIGLFKDEVAVDMVLMDLNMPRMDGFEAAEWITKNQSGIKIIILTMYDSEIALIRLLQAGVYGFLKKDIHPYELNHALLKVAQGDYYYSQDTTLKLASLFRKNANNSSLQKSVFADKEIEFIKLASQEMTYKDIAIAMGVSPRHIDYYRITVFEKLGVQSRIGLVIYAVKNGLVSF